MSYRVHASTVNLRTAAVRACLLDERDYPVTDLGHWMRVALDWDLAFLARPLARYRIHEGAYSAGAAAVTEGGYIQGAERIEKFLEVKLRFLAEHGDRLDGVRGLRAAAQRAFRRELLEHAAHATFPERRLVPTVRALRACTRLDAATLIEPAAWRLAAGGLIGPRAMSALKRLRRAPRTSLEVTGMKVAILAGGLGSRLSEETEIKPKPMVEIGGRPILWHIMKHYAHYGFKDFVDRARLQGRVHQALHGRLLRRCTAT